jgi:hypothetical protein
MVPLFEPLGASAFSQLSAFPVSVRPSLDDDFGASRFDLGNEIRDGIRSILVPRSVHTGVGNALRELHIGNCSIDHKRTSRRQVSIIKFIQRCTHRVQG